MPSGFQLMPTKSVLPCPRAIPYISEFISAAPMLAEDYEPPLVFEQDHFCHLGTGRMTRASKNQHLHVRMHCNLSEFSTSLSL